MEAQKSLSMSLRNSGFLPPLAADRVYDHNGAVGRCLWGYVSVVVCVDVGGGVRKICEGLNGGEM